EEARQFPLLAADNRLLGAEEVFFNDAPWFADRIEPGKVRLLHSGLPAEIRRLPWVRSLAADVTERPVGEWRETGDRRAAERAAALEQIVQSGAFRQGLARLVAHEHGECRLSGFNWLARASVRAVDEIRSELVVEFDGRETAIGS